MPEVLSFIAIQFKDHNLVWNSVQVQCDNVSQL